MVQTLHIVTLLSNLNLWYLPQKRPNPLQQIIFLLEQESIIPFYANLAYPNILTSARSGEKIGHIGPQIVVILNN